MFEYADSMIDSVESQLPDGLKHLNFAIIPTAFDEPPTVTFTDGSRTVECQLQEDGTITDIDIARLCVTF